MFKKLSTLLFFITLFSLVQAQKPLLRLPSILGDHMVLQQNAEVKFWGWSSPGTKVKIVPEWSKDTLVTVTMNTAKWETYLTTPPAGGPYSIQVFGFKKSITLEDVLIGELWLCGGQSNMDWSAERGIVDAIEEIPNSANSQIRLFCMEKATADYPQDDCKGSWEVCSPESMRTFSAVGYFFGKNLQNTLKMPVGLIHSNWGGTAAETWTPYSTLEQYPDLVTAQQQLTPSKGWDNTIGSTYNAMVHPITPMKLAGIIWYQGEANCPNAYTYSELQQTMVQSWREKFQANLPFYYVQIAPYERYPIPYSAALVREQQEKAMAQDKTGMVVVSDLVDDIRDIHPRYKKQVGIRLSNWALAETYGLSTPKYKHARLKETRIEKNKIQALFSDLEGGLVCPDKVITYLEIAGADGVFYPADGQISKKGHSLWLSAKQVKEPKYVRYAFANGAIGNLFDVSGLPIAPFRTDNEVFDLSIRVKK